MIDNYNQNPNQLQYNAMNPNAMGNMQALQNINGVQNPSSNITHLPLAPNVELTALVNFVIPSKTLFLASSPKLKFLTIASDIFI